MRLDQSFFLGIDGGGTKCKARLENARGDLLGEVITGPANAARDLQGTINAIEEACQLLQQDLGHANLRLANVHAGIGLAGVNIPSVREQVLDWQHPFASMQLATDLHIACLGAHNGQDGAIIITGTGSSGASIIGDKYLEIGGHGFVIGDTASGAWLGKKAIAHTLEALDRLIPKSELAAQVMTFLHCKTSLDLVRLTINASPRFFAQLAPLVLANAQQQEPIAKALVETGADYINRMARRLLTTNPPSLSIIGGVSQHLLSWLDQDVQGLISQPKHSPEIGAICLAKSVYEKETIQ